MSPTPKAASVLIVDDKPENLVALEAVLRPLQLRVVRAGSGEEALRRLLDEDYAVILLDVQMPEMDGFETAEFIKRRDKTAHIPIIFVTAIDKEQRQVFRGYSVGAVDYIFKPYDPDVLRSKVATFVELYRKTSELRTSEEQFRTAFAHAPIGIALIDPQGEWMQVNRALTELVGYPQPELLDRRLWDLSHREDRDANRKELERLFASGVASFELEQRLVHRDGKVIYVIVSASLARDADRNPLHYVVQLVDLTERRQAELERDAREREQAARVEAEAVADTIGKIQRVTDAALAHLELDDLLRELVEHFREILAVDAAAVLLMEPGDAIMRLGAVAGLDGAVEEEMLIEVGEGFAGAIARDGEPASVEAIEGPGVLDRALVAGGMHSLVGVPMLVEGRVTGVICAGTRAPRSFSDGDRSLLQLVADRAALAVEHARLYKRELGIVETLQRSLLPERLPRLPGLDIAARYMPGGPGADVGGDWYDAMPLPDGRIGLAMGDVVGHGIGAAALMGQLRNALRAYAVEGHGPGEVVAKLDRLVQTLESGRMATLLYLVIEPASGAMQFSTAGHLPPLVVGPDGSATYLEGGRTLPLGVLPHAQYEVGSAEIEPGSVVVLYTDGLVEERGVPLDRGLEALRTAVTLGPEDPDGLCEHIIESVLGQRTATDDVAVLVLRTMALANERVELELGADPNALRTLRKTLGRWLEAAGATDEESRDIQMACHEASSNAIEHGHKFGEAEIRLEAELDGAEVAITVTDAGQWREPRESDRGRGLQLVEAFMDSVEIEPGQEGTVVRMRRRIAGREEGKPAVKKKGGGGAATRRRSRARGT